MCVGYTVIQVDDEVLAGKRWVLVQRPGGRFYLLIPKGREVAICAQTTRYLAAHLADELRAVS